MRTPQPKRLSNSIQILIAAANQAGTKARKLVLEEKGYAVVIASKSKDALQQLEENCPSVLIVDYSLEHGKGLALLDLVCESAPDMPTILLADPLQEIEADLSNCRADVVVAKQFDEIPQLLRSVEKLLRRRLPRKRPGTVSKSKSSSAKKLG